MAEFGAKRTLERKMAALRAGIEVKANELGATKSPATAFPPAAVMVAELQRLGALTADEAARALTRLGDATEQG